MFSPDDTVVAISTPPGRGGIGVVRITGGDALPVARAILDRRAPLIPRYATLVRVIRPDHPGQCVDRVIATYFPAPASYTGQDVVELSAHGSPVILGQIVAAAVGAGARLAEPGEFTFRAYLSGRIDLVQAEAVADLIDAVTPLQARAAFDQLEGTLTNEIREIERDLFDLLARFEASLDFPEEGYHFIEPGAAAAAMAGIRSRVHGLLCSARRGRLVREGLHVTVTGTPNVGKSSLFNHLIGTTRAIVSEVPGTTRDLVTETGEVDGIRLSFVDTAGIRESLDAVEQEGVSRARGALAVANLVLLVLDRSRPLDQADHDLLAATAQASRVIVVNKIDLPAAWDAQALERSSPLVALSLRTLSGTGELRPAIARVIGANEPLRDTPAVTNIRHIGLLERAEESLASAIGALGGNGPALSEEFVVADLQHARAAFEEIVGTRSSDELLHHIFENFCVGK